MAFASLSFLLTKISRLQIYGLASPLMAVWRSAYPLRRIPQAVPRIQAFYVPMLPIPPVIPASWRVYLIEDYIFEAESPHLVGRAMPDAEGKARPTVNHLTVMNYVKLNKRFNFGVQPACVVGASAPYNHGVPLAGVRVAALHIKNYSPAHVNDKIFNHSSAANIRNTFSGKARSGIASSHRSLSTGSHGILKRAARRYRTRSFPR